MGKTHLEPGPYADDDSRWIAVQTRDASADGHFVYAVKTTKIYCRPICKARLPRRANVSFYSEGLAAQLGGFRACKRCKPELDGSMPEEAAVRKIRAFIRDSQAPNANKKMPSLSQMARQTGLSKWHFHRVFKKCAGMTPGEFLRPSVQQQMPSPPLTDDAAASEALDFDYNFNFNFNCGPGDEPFWSPDADEQSWLDELLQWPDDIPAAK